MADTPIVKHELEVSPLAIIAQAMEKGIDADQLGKLMDLQERFERNKANAAYNQAMAAAQSQMPIVLRDKFNDFTKKRYSSLESVNADIKPIYSQHGFSLTFCEEECKTPGSIRIRCDVSHAAGCTRQVWGEFPLDGTGASGGRSGMNAVQAKGSTFTYGRRYLTLNIFNVVIEGEDKDGSEAGDFINNAQVGEINDLIHQCEAAGKPVDFKKFLEWLNVKSLDLLPQRELAKAVTELKNKLRAAKEGKK